MLKKMRQYTKIILWVVTVAFVGTIIFAWGAGGLRTGRDPNIIGVVDGVEVPRLQYDSIYRQEYDKAIKETTDGELTEERIKQIHSKVWNQIQNEILLGKEVEGLEIGVSDRELVEFMKRMPLPEVQSQEAFQTNGKFDYSKYLAMMENPEANWVPIENFVRNRMTMMKLQELAVASVYITEDDVRDEFEDKNLKASAEYVFFRPPSTPQGTTATDDELKKYFDEHKSEFSFAQQESRAVLSLATFLPYVVPSVADSIVNQLKSIRQRILDGEDFGMLASQYTQDNPGSNGDLPWTKQGGYVPEFEERVLAEKLNGITEPFRSRFGYHIARFEGTRQSQDGTGKPITEMKCSHILMEIEPAEEGKAGYEMEIKDLKGVSGVDEFEKKARKLGARITVTEPLTKAGRIQELPMDSQKLIQWALGSEAGAVSDMFATRNGYVIACIKEKIEAKMPEFAEVKDVVATKYATQLALDQLEQTAKSFAAQAALDPSNFKAAAAKYNLEVLEQLDFVRSKFLGGNLPGQPKFKAGVLNLAKENPISKPIWVESGIYVIHLLDITPFIPEMYSAQHDSIQNALLSDKQSKIFQDWYRKLVEESKIEDFRTPEEMG